jgi:hypothetical protein
LPESGEEECGLLVRKYLIEVPHSPEECWVPPVEAAVERARLRSYRGCDSGTHTTWIIAELATEDEAWSLVPVLLRDTARVVDVESKELDRDAGGGGGTRGRRRPRGDPDALAPHGDGYPGREAETRRGGQLRCGRS